MAWSTIDQRNDGQTFGGPNFDEARDAIFELQDSIGADVPAFPVDGRMRHARSRNGANLPGETTRPMFPSNASGSTIEDIGGIAFTQDAENGFFTVSEAGIYAVTVAVRPDTGFGAGNGTGTVEAIIAGERHTVPLTTLDSRASTISVTKYLAASTNITAAVRNHAATSRTADLWHIDVTWIGS